MRLKIITPIIADQEECKRREKGYKKSVRKDTEISVVGLQTGPTYLDYDYECIWSDWAVLQEGLKSEEKGYDAVIPDCVFDPAVKALREKLNILVVPPLETSIHVAATLGGNFSVLALDERMVHILKEKVENYGLSSRLASVRSMDIDYKEELEEDAGNVFLEKAIAAGMKAVDEDKADVIVLGCTAMFASEEMMKKLNIPVIEPGVLAAKTAEVLFDLKLSQSKKAYPSPSKEYEEAMPIVE